MSNKETKNTENEKVVTKYDRKMQARNEQKEKEKRQQRLSTIVGVVIVIALVCLVASFPIRNYLAVNETYIKIDGENISRVEYDYNYYNSRNAYLTQYGAYLSMMGLDASSNLETQMYSDTLTWKDFFDQMTVENMVNQKAMLAQAEAEGFTADTDAEFANFEKTLAEAAQTAGVSEKEYIQQVYGPYATMDREAEGFTADTDAEFANFEKTLAEAAQTAGVSEKEYIQQVYGPYATMDRISGYVKNSILISEYYDSVAEQKAPSEEEIQAYYEENKESYDSVDYRLVTVDAELPTEPTELADPVEETGAADAADAETEPAEGTEKEPYKPSEAEIEAAMAEAKVKAEEAEKTVAKEGELHENVTKAGAVSMIADWLFDSARKAGDTTVIENEASHRYYVLAFEKRYLDETPSADARVLGTKTEDGQALLDEWKAGEATEESFAALCAEHSDDVYTAAEGGLYEGITKGSMREELSTWLFDGARAAGDTVSITTTGETEEEKYTYVMYYVGQNDPAWKLSIRATLQNEAMNAYAEEISADIQVEDPKDRLNYLKAEAESTETATAETESIEAETAETETESADAETVAETAETETAAE